MMMSGAWRVAADLSLSWWKSISSGLHVVATVWCGVSAMSGGFQVQVGGVQAADVSPSSSSFVGVVGGVVMGVSGKRQASVLLLELLVVVHHRPSSSVESWLPAVGDGIRMVDDRGGDERAITRRFDGRGQRERGLWVECHTEEFCVKVLKFEIVNSRKSFNYFSEVVPRTIETVR